MKLAIPARVALLCLLAALATVLVACGSAAITRIEPTPVKMAKTTTVGGLRKEGVLTVGLRNTASIPLVVEQQGTLTGLDVDLAASLANELGLTASFRIIDDVAEALNGTCDIVMSASASDDAPYKVLGHYADTATAFFHAGKADVVAVEDLSNKTVAVEEGSSAQRSLRITNLTVREATYPLLSDAFEGLQGGKVDYVLCHTITGAYLTTRHDGLAFAGSLSEPVANGIAVAAGNNDVIAAIKRAYKSIEKSGALAKAQSTWLGSMPTLSKQSQIANIPLKETSGESLEELSSGEGSLPTKKDGSAAGANAVTLGGTRSRGASSSDSSDSSSSTSSQVVRDDEYYNADYDEDVAYQSQQGQAVASAQDYSVRSDVSYDDLLDEQSFGTGGEPYGNQTYGNQTYVDQTYADQTYADSQYGEQYAAPQYDEPQYSEPQYAGPQYSEPRYDESQSSEQYSEPQYSEPQYSEPQYSEPQYSEPQPSEQYYEPAPTYDYANDASSGTYDDASGYQDSGEAASYDAYASNESGYGDVYADYGTNDYVAE